MAGRVGAPDRGIERVMRNLIVTENLTLDGVMAPMGDWFEAGATDKDLLAANIEHREAADALVLGRVTYQEFVAFWPAQADDQTGISDYLNQVDKYVVSASLERADWPNSTILRGPVEEQLASLKAGPGKDIVVTGSASLVTSLLPTRRTAGISGARYRSGVNWAGHEDSSSRTSRATSVVVVCP